MKTFLARRSIAYAVMLLFCCSTAYGQYQLTALAYHRGTNTGTFLPTDSTHYFYDNASSLMPKAQTSYKSGNPIAEYKADFTYDGAGNRTSVTSANWNPATASFQYFGRHRNTYNPANVRIGVVTEDWDDVQKTWLNASRFIYTLDAQNKVVGLLSQVWSTTPAAWVNAERHVHTNNAQGKFTKIVVQAWDAVAATWQNKQRFDAAYDASDTARTSETAYFWNLSSGVWDEHSRSQFTYNATGLRETYVLQLWDTAGKTFYNVSREYDSYNGAGNLVRSLSQQWNSATQLFDNRSQTAQTFNTFNQITASTTLPWVSGAYIINSGASRRMYYYEPFTPTAVAAVASYVALKVFPVPAYSSLNIALDAETAQPYVATIADMAGRAYITFSTPAQAVFATTIAVTDLPAGNYLLSVKASSGANASQMITVAH